MSFLEGFSEEGRLLVRDIHLRYIQLILLLSLQVFVEIS